MERLLNIKEAAEILNVSQMTIRRWTNAGSLRCYRIGGKHERRFKLQDLHEYIDRGVVPEKPSMVSLGFGNFRVPDGSHLTHLSSHAREGLDIGTSYVLEGLNNRENVLMVAPEDGTEAFIRVLHERGADVDNLRKGGRLYLSQGMDSPVSMITYISRVAATSGRPFRVFGDMSWTRSRGWTLEALRELEEAANTAMIHSGALFLCQYSLDTFSGLAVMMAVETHRQTIYRGELTESPYFGKKS